MYVLYFTRKLILTVCHSTRNSFLIGISLIIPNTLWCGQYLLGVEVFVLLGVSGDIGLYSLTDRAELSRARHSILTMCVNFLQYKLVYGLRKK